MSDLLKSILDHGKRGENVVLCQIISSAGSAPRGPGARMAVFADGTAAGTVGGGNVELMSLKVAKELLQEGGSLLRRFPLHPSSEGDLGMICGGDVEILFQTLRGDSEETQQFLKALDEMRGTNAWLILRLDPASGVADAGLYSEERGLRFWKGSPDAVQELQRTPVLKDGTLYTEQIFCRGTVYLFGGGHVGAALVPVLAPLGFRVVVLDDREALAKPENFPAAAEVRLCSFQDIGSQISLTKDDYCVIMTPGHKSDRAILSQVLRSPAAYLGCIGSRKKIALTNALLIEAGFTKEECERVHSPIGLSIGAVTPEEIAVSIAAELIAFRAGLIA